MKKVIILAGLVLAGGLEAYQDTRALISDLYQGISSDKLKPGDEALIRGKGGDPRYGEITFDGVDILLKELQMGPLDIFYDLGSGFGKMIVQVYLETPVAKSAGIELAFSRIKQARKVKQKMGQLGLLDPERRLVFYHKNIIDIPLRDATVIYVNMFSMAPALREAFVNKLLKLKPGLRVVSTERIAHERLKVIKQITVPMTWDPKVAVYISELQG